MISVKSAFSKFNTACKSIPGSEHIPSIIELLVRGIEITSSDDHNSINVLYITLGGELKISVDKADVSSKSIYFNNLLCSYDGCIVTLFDISCNDIFYKIKLQHEASAIIFSEKYNELVNSFNKFKKITINKKQYFKLV